MKTLAIITARGGSKRIPRKNIRPFCGRPIIGYSIEAALESGVFDTVMVSTDDTEIGEIAKQFGAELPFMRSEATASDHATTSEVLLEVLDRYEQAGEHFDIACCLYPTSPFITPGRLKEAFTLLSSSDADTLIPVVPFSYPPQRAYVVDNGRLVFKHPEFINARTQDMEKLYHDAGQFYLFRTEAFKRTANINSGNILPLELDDMEVQDIDTETDWHLAELKYRLQKENNA